MKNFILITAAVIIFIALMILPGFRSFSRRVTAGAESARARRVRTTGAATPTAAVGAGRRTRRKETRSEAV